METWNREELYKEVWDDPVTKVAARYGVSDVMIAKICRKLSIPLPGRGYWARKAAGQKLSAKSLPTLKEIPVIQRFKKEPRSEDTPPSPEPTDSLYLRIREMESRSIPLESISTRHQSVVATEKRLRNGTSDRDEILLPRSNSGSCLDLRVSLRALDRALNLANALIVTLENEDFKIFLEQGLHGTSVSIFGHQIKFGIVELLEITATREEGDGIWKTTVRDHRPTGRLELRIGDFTYGPRLRDRRRLKLEERLPECVGALMREARKEVLAAEEQRQREIKKHQRDQELSALSEEIRKEEARVKELEGRVGGWLRAREIRDFANALEAVWVNRREDVSNGSEKGERLNWIRQQANRCDPLVVSAPSVLDRKSELRYW
jgi:hypothetical protein